MNSSNFLNYTDVPNFSSITRVVIEEGICSLLQMLEVEVAEVELHGNATWELGVEPIALALTKLQTVWGKVSHLYSVKNSAELREVYSKVQPLVIKFGLRVSQSKKIFSIFEDIRADASFLLLDEPRRRFIDSWILNARQSGVDLVGEKLEIFNSNQERLAQRSVDFSNNVLDDIKVRGVVVTNEADLAGTPAEVIARCRQRGQLAGGDNEYGDNENGKNEYFVSVDPTVSRQVLQHCHNESLRRRIYRECLQIASDGKNNNRTVLDEIVVLKSAQAKLLGYATTADMCLESRMAKEPRVAIDFLENLLKEARPVALRQFEKITEFTHSRIETDVQLGDMLYWIERLREERLGFSVEELRPYFPLHTVLNGLIKLIHLVFGVTIRKADEPVDVWHSDVLYFLVENNQGEQIASFYFDPFVRPENKRGGAWMGICRYGYTLSNGERSLPISYIVCNQTPLNSEGHSLMTFEEVTTLFHEFGHALHHMLAPLSWIGTSPIELSEWDSIEIESQFMEGWCYEPAVLRLITGHYKTGEVLPDHFIEALQKERRFFRGNQIVRQLHLGLTDLYIFSDSNPEKLDVQKVYHEIGTRTRELAPLPEDSMLCAFNHIFSGGYTAGYYSYIWSQVLSADLFHSFCQAEREDYEQWSSRVRQRGADFSQRFFTVAGSIDPLTAFENYMNRKPESGAFLDYNGIRE